MILIRPREKFDRKFYKHLYYIYADGRKVGEITMKKFRRYILIAFIGIYDDERRKGYATKAIRYLLDNYDIDGIVGEVVCSNCAEKFWDNVFKLFNCEKYNTTHFHNTVGSFVVNRLGNENFPDEDFVANCLYEASKI